MEGEKIVCCDSGRSDALAYAMGAAGNRNNDPMAMAAMMNNSQWMNNPFIYLVFLMMFGRNGLWVITEVACRMPRFRRS